jgi:hypothetical protein
MASHRKPGFQSRLDERNFVASWQCFLATGGGGPRSLINGLDTIYQGNWTCLRARVALGPNRLVERRCGGRCHQIDLIRSDLASDPIWQCLTAICFPLMRVSRRHQSVSFKMATPAQFCRPETERGPFSELRLHRRKIVVLEMKAFALTPNRALFNSPEVSSPSLNLSFRNQPLTSRSSRSLSH